MNESVFNLAKEMSFEEIGDSIYELNKASYEEKPVDIETFIKDPYFLGALYGGDEESEFYPFWMDKMKKLHPSPFYTPYSEVILHLPIGSGKSVFALTSIVYDLYKLICLKDPQTYFGIRPKGTQIIFTIFSALKYLAADDEWGRFSGMVENCQWFRDHHIFPVTRKLHVDPTVILSKNVGITIGTGAVHALGKAVIGGILDEANFAATKNDKAKDAYLAISRRMESRFLQIGGTLPGILFLASSPKFSTSFLNERIEAAKKSTKTFVISNAPIWEIKHHLNLYSGKTFPIFIGDSFSDPEILTEELVATKDPANVLEVPVEYKDTFEKDLIEAIRDIVGSSITGSLSFFRGRNPIVFVATMPHRFSREVIELNFDGDEAELLSFANTAYFKNPIHPESWRFIHVDLSVTRDKTGIGCVYCVPQKVEFVDETGRQYEKSVRSYFMDWLLVIKAKPGEEVPHYKIEAFLIWLKRNQYPIKQVTFDQYQSRTTMQNLSVQGFETKHCSVDASRDAYIGLRSEILNKSILITNHSLLIEELANLQDDGSKIDHLPHLSKDAADGLAGAYFGCNQSNTVMRIQDITPREQQYPGRFKDVRDLFKQQKLKGAGKMILPNMSEYGIRL